MNKIFWRPSTNCCWHAFVFIGDELVSLCEKETITEDKNKKTLRPPVLYRCVACLREENFDRDRNLPATDGWGTLIKQNDASFEIEDCKVFP